MDTTFPDNTGRWRAIMSPWVHHAVYLLITATECSVALLCWLGAFRLYRSRSDASRFNRNKDLAVCGLTLGIVLWFTGFITIGGEWFLMWQSQTWNGQQAAFRLAAMMGISLVYVVMPDHDNDA
jgi:predicted small integral membrane protein